MFSVNILFEDAEDPIEDVTLTAREGGREGTRSMFVDGDSGRLSGRALKKIIKLKSLWFGFHRSATNPIFFLKT